eukprot:jgi/Botrbrau1/8228/Bobra.0392s0024.1
MKARKTLQRARFAQSVRLFNTVDEQGIKYLLKHLPAWIKFSDYERVKFLNDALQTIWPAFDAAVSSYIQERLLPALKEDRPSAIADISFERLFFGEVPLSIMGGSAGPLLVLDSLSIGNPPQSPEP